MTRLFLFLFNVGDHMAPSNRHTNPIAILEGTTAPTNLGRNEVFFKASTTRVKEVITQQGTIRLEDSLSYDFQYFTSEQRVASEVAFNQLSSVLEKVAVTRETLGDKVCPPFPLVVAHLDAENIRLYHFCDIAQSGAVFLNYYEQPFSEDSIEFDGFCQLIENAHSSRIARHQLLNDRCWYSRWNNGWELERKFTFSDLPDIWALTVDLYQEMLQGKIKGFVPELDMEFQVFDYDSYIYDIFSPMEEAGYVSFIPQSNGLMTIKRKWFQENAELRRETVMHDVNLNLQNVEDKLAEIVPGGQFKVMPAFRRKRFDVNMESLETGNIYGVYFDICRLIDYPAGPSFGQCEVEYCRTRTLRDVEKVEEEFEEIANYVRVFLERKEVAFNHDLYSKLDFVREAAEQLEAGMGKTDSFARLEVLAAPALDKLDTYLVTGNWKIRHNEPVSPEDSQLCFYRLNDDMLGTSVFLDLRKEFDAVQSFSKGQWVNLENTVSERNLNAASVPLAIVRLLGDQFQLTHLCSRVESHITHMLSPKKTADVIGADIFQGICSAYLQHHVKMSNFECYYVKGMPDTELEQKFNIATPYDYLALNRLFYSALDDGEIEGFRPQLGDEIQQWSYDNNFCRILPNKKGVGGYVSIMHWSRVMRDQWADPVVTFKKKLFHEDALERWERNYHGLRIEGTPEESLAAYFDLPLEKLPEWRRTRYDIACECEETANIFMVNFEDTRVWEENAHEGQLQQCEIEYLKTRGEPDKLLIYRDFETLCQRVEAFMEERNLSFQRSNYSKMTFLKDYLASKLEMTES